MTTYYSRFNEWKHVIMCDEIKATTPKWDSNYRFCFVLFCLFVVVVVFFLVVVVVVVCLFCFCLFV